MVSRLENLPTLIETGQLDEADCLLSSTPKWELSCHDKVVQKAQVIALEAENLEAIELLAKKIPFLGLLEREQVKSLGFPVDRRVIPLTALVAGSKYAVEILDILVKNGLPIKEDDPCPQLDKEWGPDHHAMAFAVLAGSKPAVEYLLSKGADVNARISILYDAFRSNTPLGVAAFSGHDDLVDLLIANGAELEPTFDALHSLYGKSIGHSEDFRDQLEFMDPSDPKRPRLEDLAARREEEERNYAKALVKLMDHCAERKHNFKARSGMPVWRYFKTSLTFLESRDVSGMNFDGVTIGGHPISPEILKKGGCQNIEKACFSADTK